MSLLKHIKHLIQASALAEAEDRKLQSKHGIDTGLGVDPFAPEVVKWAFEDRPEEKKIKLYLDDLEYDTLLKLETMMYFGRDGGAFQEVLSYLAELKDTKDEIVRTVVEKRSAYPVYFEKALDSLKKQGIDVESL